MDRKRGEEQGATWHKDGGYHDATHRAQCSGNNGGCGVTAFAIPGHPDGGDAECTGYCAKFSHGGSSTWVKTQDAGWKRAKAAGIAIDPKTHEPIVDPKTGRPKIKIGKNKYGGQGTCAKGGKCELSVRNLGDKKNGKPVTCTAPCKPVRGENGQRVWVDGKGQVQVRTPTTPGGKKFDEATDPKSAGSYRDDKGRGMGWAKTTGSIKDAFTGSRATAKGGGGVTAGYGSKRGDRFTVACPSGCRGVLRNGQKKGKKFVQDTFDVGGKNGKKGTNAWFVARDKHNTPAMGGWTGAGTFRSFEGVTAVAKGDGPTLTGKGPGKGKWTPNTTFVRTAGLGAPHGRFEINGQSGYVELPNGRKIENNYQAKN
ncbi:MAG: hypothetical protein ACRDXB_10845, partial [Actinomycetes bacterium]